MNFYFALFTLLFSNSVYAGEIADPHQADREKLAQAVVVHGKAMSELKERFNKTSGSISAQGSMAAAPYTQTEGFLKWAMPDYEEIDPKQDEHKIRTQTRNNILRFFKNKKIAGNQSKCLAQLEATNPKEFNRYIDTLTDALMAERTHRDKLVFYHGTSAEISFLMDFYSEVRNQLSIRGSQQVYLRPFDTIFAKYPTLEIFLEEFTKLDGTANDLEGRYQEMGLSTNPFLFGNATHGGSCTTEYFYDSTAAQPPNLEKLYGHIKTKLGFSASYEELQNIFNQYKLHEKKVGGSLLQFFLAPSSADDVAHLSGALGFVKSVMLSDSEPKYHGVSKTLPLMGRDPKQFEALKLTVDALQARIFLRPDILYHSSENSIHVYTRSESDPRPYKRAMANFVQSQLSHTLANGTRISQRDLNNDLRLKDLFSRVHKTRFGTDVPEKNTNRPLNLILENDDGEEVTHYLETHPELDLKASVQDTGYYQDTQLSGANPILFALKKEKNESLKAILDWIGIQHFLTDPEFTLIRDELFKVLASKSGRSTQLAFFDLLSLGLNPEEKAVLKAAVDARADTGGSILMNLIGLTNSGDLTRLNRDEKVKTIPVLLNLARLRGTWNELVENNNFLALAVKGREFDSPEQESIVDAILKYLARIEPTDERARLNSSLFVERYEMGGPLSQAFKAAHFSNDPSILRDVVNHYLATQGPLTYDGIGKGVLGHACGAAGNSSPEKSREIAEILVGSLKGNLLLKDLANCVSNSQGTGNGLASALLSRLKPELLTTPEYTVVKSGAILTLLQNTDKTFILERLNWLSPDFSSNELKQVEECIQRAELPSSILGAALSQRCIQASPKLSLKVLSFYHQQNFKHNYDRVSLLTQSQDDGRYIWDYLAALDLSGKSAEDPQYAVFNQAIGFLRESTWRPGRTLTDTRGNHPSPFSQAYAGAMKNGNLSTLKTFLNLIESEGKSFHTAEKEDILNQLFKVRVKNPEIARQALRLILDSLKDPENSGSLAALLSGKLSNDGTPPLIKALRAGNFSLFPVGLQIGFELGLKGVYEKDRATAIFAAILGFVTHLDGLSAEQQKSQLHEFVSTLHQTIQTFESHPEGVTHLRECLQSSQNSCSPISMTTFCHDMAEPFLGVPKINLETLISFLHKVSTDYKTKPNLETDLLYVEKFKRLLTDPKEIESFSKQIEKVRQIVY